MVERPVPLARLEHPAGEVIGERRTPGHRDLEHRNGRHCAADVDELLAQMVGALPALDPLAPGEGQRRLARTESSGPDLGVIAIGRGSTMADRGTRSKGDGGGATAWRSSVVMRTAWSPKCRANEAAFSLSLISCPDRRQKTGPGSIPVSPNSRGSTSSVTKVAPSAQKMAAMVDFP